MSLHLISSTPLKEISKLSVLFEHYSEHKSVDLNITFIQFVIDHYSNTPHTDKDEERDNQLPFKTMSEGHMHQHIAVTTSRIKLEGKPIYLLAKSYNGAYQEQFVASPSTGKVWQPPKQMI